MTCDEMMLAMHGLSADAIDVFLRICCVHPSMDAYTAHSPFTPVQIWGFLVRCVYTYSLFGTRFFSVTSWRQEESLTLTHIFIAHLTYIFKKYTLGYRTMTPWFDAIFNSLLAPNCVIALEGGVLRKSEFHPCLFDGM